MCTKTPYTTTNPRPIDGVTLCGPGRIELPGLDTEEPWDAELPRSFSGWLVPMSSYEDDIISVSSGLTVPSSSYYFSTSADSLDLSESSDEEFELPEQGAVTTDISKPARARVWARTVPPTRCDRQGWLTHLCCWACPKRPDDDPSDDIEIYVRSPDVERSRSATPAMISVVPHGGESLV
ncbi:ORF4 [Silurid herpesvirus 1]|nr:ORF4 [Silurid herpesvirus 1]AVP72254.1 ORF4 [Silurid herpesvirus 1]